MAKVNDVLRFLFALAPAHMQEQWDNVGLLVGHADADVKKVLVALDPTMEVLQEAKAKGCELVVTHHPVIFGGIKNLTVDNIMGSRALFAAENHIACINMHTNLDSVQGGVNDILAEKVGLREYYVAAPKGMDTEKGPYGYLRVGYVDETDLEIFAKDVKGRLCCRGIRYVSGGKSVHKVAVGGGACNDEIGVALEHGCDTLLTADFKYHQFCDAMELGLNLIDAGHYNTEAPVCAFLVDVLRQQFPEIAVQLSESPNDKIFFA